MISTTRIVFVLLLAGGATNALAEQGCGAAQGWESVDFAGEVYGSHGFDAPAGQNRFVLAPTEFGWRIEVQDEASNDLAALTPPLRLVETNPRNIAGWHFRSQDNSGPNRGDVNAPQVLRQFIFGERGRGELIIEDFGLADLDPGRRARMVYMKFRACMEWAPGLPAVIAPTPAEPGVPERVVLRMTLCGLDTDTYRLSDRMTNGREGRQRPFLEPDLDGDGQTDMVAPITRIADQSPGLALCLASGSRLILAGFSGRIGVHLDPIYFRRVDWWNVYPRGSVNRSEEGLPPVLTGDGILLGKEGASSVLLYLSGEVVSSYWQGD